MSKESIRVTKDSPSVTASGEPINRLPDGVRFRPAVNQIDDRGSVCELFDPRWQWHPDPLVFVYMFTLRPGKTKGWGMHKLHEDRYFVILGEMQVIMYDDRPDSSTRHTVSSIVLSEYHRGLLNIPVGIWHANRNLGNKDAIIVNFPTQPYNHDDPDKYRLPLDTDQIPYKFEDLSGW